MACTESEPLRILILGGDADGNLGDRAILYAMCRELRAVRSDAHITVVSADPDRCTRELDVAVVPRGPRGLRALCSAAARSDLVLCGGGGLFQDDDSLVKMPYWGLRVALARLLCSRVVGYALGVGPLRVGSSRLFARLAFACMERISVRDPLARATAASLTRKPVTIVPDPAILLPPVPRDTARAWLAEHGVPLDGRPLIGCTTRRWFPARNRLIPNHVAVRLRRHPAPPAPEARRLTALLAEVLDDVVARHNAHILFLPTYVTPAEGDDRVCADILGAMTSTQGQMLHINSPALYKGVAAELRVLLAGRMHPTIFAASVGTPVVGLAYNQKFNGFFELLGLGDRVMQMESFVTAGGVDELSRLVDRAMDDAPALRVSMAELSDQVRTFTGQLLECGA